MGFLGIQLGQVQQGIRTGLACTFTLALGYGLYGQLVASASEQWAGLVMDMLQWASITSASVAAVHIGRVANTSLQRTIGTLSGAAVAVLLALDGSAWLLSLGCFLVTTAASVAGSRFGLDYSGKLASVTYVLIAAGAVTAPERPLVRAGFRVAGILSGVFVTAVVSVTYFPVSATDQVLQMTHSSLVALQQLAELTWSGMQASWQHDAADLPLGVTPQPGGKVSPDGTPMVAGAAGAGGAPPQAEPRPAATARLFGGDAHAGPGAPPPAQQASLGSQGAAGPTAGDAPHAAGAAVRSAVGSPRQVAPPSRQPSMPTILSEADLTSPSAMQKVVSLQELREFGEQPPLLQQRQAMGSRSSVSAWLQSVPSMRVDTLQQALEPVTGGGAASPHEGSAGAHTGAPASSASPAQGALLAGQQHQHQQPPYAAPGHMTSAFQQAALQQDAAAGGQVLPPPRRIGNDGSRAAVSRAGADAGGLGHTDDALSQGSAAKATILSGGAAAFYVNVAPLTEEQRAELRESIDQRCEDSMLKLHTALNKASENLGFAEDEIYLGVLLGRRVYLPYLIPWGLHRRKTFHLPAPAIRATFSSMKACARSVWMLHQALQEGFDAGIMRTLQERHLAPLVEAMHVASMAFLGDCVAAMARALRPEGGVGAGCCPSGRQRGCCGGGDVAIEMAAAAAQPGARPEQHAPGGGGSDTAAAPGVPDQHLRAFRAAIDALLEMSEAQRTQLIQHIRRYRQPVLERARTSDSDGAFSFSEPAVDEVLSLGRHSISRQSSAGGPLTPVRRSSSLGQRQLPRLKVPAREQGPTLQPSGQLPPTPGSGQPSSGQQPTPGEPGAAGGAEMPPAWQGAYSTVPEGSEQEGLADAGTLPPSAPCPPPVILPHVDTPRLFFDSGKPGMDGFLIKVRWFSTLFLMVDLERRFTDLHSRLSELLPQLPGAAQGQQAAVRPQ